MIKLKRTRLEPQVSAGSMADIAFLLLIFFLVATKFIEDRGLLMQLPPDVPPTDTPIRERNLFKIRINSQNQFLVENKVRQNLDGLIEEIKLFVLNPKNDPTLAEAPHKGIISVKAQRGTKYAYFIETLDLIKEAYYQIYGERVGLSSAEYRRLNRDNPLENEKYLRGKEGLPMNISIAEPDKIK
ncbi:MAG: biopolymer transporter ExbD [Cyclobacteriaceae bacterium]